MVTIIQLRSEHPRTYFRRCAQIHIEEIHHGTLPELGLDFLARVYFELVRLPKAGIWCAIEQDNILGFIAGCANVRQSYLTIIRNAGVALFFLALPSLLHSRVIRKKVVALLTYPLTNYQKMKNGVEGINGQGAELLAIAIAKTAQRQGLGKKLVIAFESGLKNWDISGHYFVATNADDPVSNAFYHHLGFSPYYLKEHNDLVLQIYKKLLP